MFNVLCFGDSNTWGAVPGTESERFAPDVRWPGAMRSALGADYHVTENGLNGRTTTFDRFPRPWRNGKDLLVSAIEINHPLDIVIILLGTNDVSLPYLSVADIVRGAGELVSIVRECDDFGPDGGSPPRPLLVAPHVVGALDAESRPFHEGAEDKSRELVGELGRYASKVACDFVDLSGIVTPSPVDPWHWEAAGHRAAGAAIAAKVQDMAGEPEAGK